MAGKGRTPGFVMGEAHRTKIANSKILNELIKFAEGKIEADKYPPHRVTASLGLLKKVMPDMNENLIKGAGKDGEIVVKLKFE